MRQKRIAAALENDDRSELFRVFDDYFPRRHEFRDASNQFTTVEVARHRPCGKVVVDCDYGAEGLWVELHGDPNQPSVELSHDLCVALYQWNCWLDALPDWAWNDDDLVLAKPFLDAEWDLFDQVQKRLAIEVKREAMQLRVFYFGDSYSFLEIIIDEKGQVNERVSERIGPLAACIS